MLHSVLTRVSILRVGSQAADVGQSQTNTCPISPSTLAAGASCTISVTFIPAALGSRSDTLKVNDNATNSPQKVTLSGTGIAAVTAAPATLSFGNQVIGKKSISKNVTVKNNLTTSITITSIATDLADFTTATNCPLSSKLEVGTAASGPDRKTICPRERFRRKRGPPSRPKSRL
jgi:hypothetical protein